GLSGMRDAGVERREATVRAARLQVDVLVPDLGGEERPQREVRVGLAAVGRGEERAHAPRGAPGAADARAAPPRNAEHRSQRAAEPLRKWDAEAPLRPAHDLVG